MKIFRLFSSLLRFVSLSKMLTLLHLSSRVAAEGFKHALEERDEDHQVFGRYFDVREYLQFFITPTSPCRLSSPEVVLPSSLLCSSWVVVIYYTHRHDHYQNHLLLWITLPFVIWGVSLANDPTDFVFRYLFWGLNLALLCSVLIHRYLNLKWSEEFSLSQVSMKARKEG
jgi:hypothetical protein